MLHGVKVKDHKQFKPVRYEAVDWFISATGLSRRRRRLCLSQTLLYRVRYHYTGC